MTYNIAHGRGLSPYQGLMPPSHVRRNLRKIARFACAREIDVMAVQEIDFASHWNGNCDWLEYLRGKADFRDACHGANTVRTGEKPLCYGNGLLSKTPILAHESRPFGAKTLGEKGFLYALVALKGTALPIVNAHLDFRSKARRLAQLAQLTQFLETLKLPAGCLPPLVCGDFNVSQARKGDAVCTLLRFLRARGEYALYPQRQRTFPSVLPMRRLDFFFVPAPLKAVRCMAPAFALSDHRPVVLEVEY